MLSNLAHLWLPQRSCHSEHQLKSIIVFYFKTYLRRNTDFADIHLLQNLSFQFLLHRKTSKQRIQILWPTKMRCIQPPRRYLVMWDSSKRWESNFKLHIPEFKDFLQWDKILDLVNVVEEAMVKWPFTSKLFRTLLWIEINCLFFMMNHLLLKK